MSWRTLGGHVVFRSHGSVHRLGVPIRTITHAKLKLDYDPSLVPERLFGAVRVRFPLRFFSPGIRRTLARLLILGVSARVVNAAAAETFVLWLELGWRRPIQDWFTAHGLASLTHATAMVWVFTPEWCCVFAFGVALGLVRPRSWLGDAIIFSLLYVVLDNIAFASNPVLGWRSLSLLGWHSVTIPLILFGAFVGRQGRRVPPPFIDGYPTCRECGYILRGLSSTRCPECGTEFDP